MIADPIALTAAPLTPPPTALGEPTTIIVNPHAAGGRACAVWEQLQQPLRRAFGELLVYITEQAADVPMRLHEAYSNGARRVIAIGGDGTNYALVNALAALRADQPAARMICGLLPVGTGRDWARGLGIPMGDPEAALAWLMRARPQPTDIGVITGIEGDDAASTPGAPRLFLNIASAGMGGQVTEFVNSAAHRRSWTFLAATLHTLAIYRPPAIRITVDDQPWFEGRAYVAAVANGTTFGHGMKIAPNAQPNDGLFDVVLVENTSRLTILAAFQRVYAGTHLTHPAVHHTRGAVVRIETDERIGLELDGEPAHGRDLTFGLRAGWIDLLR